MDNKEAYENLTLEMLDEFIEELDKERKFNFACGKQGMIDFQRKWLSTVLSKKEVEEAMVELEEKCPEGIYHYDGLEFKYQGKVDG